MLSNDTICAIATAQGSGAIAVIRLSGKSSISICEKLFQSPSKTKKLSEQAANTVHFGYILDGEHLIDEVLVSIFKAPHSYTGENSVEISCHASVYIQQKILQLLIEKGAKMASPGEFTMRAFLNGKIDLSQAEAVADLIASNSEAAQKVAMNQMRGGFSGEIQVLRKKLLDFVSLIELELDFSEEDVEFADRAQLENLLQQIMSLVKRLLDSFELGNVIKKGIPVVIIGEPNVGKSTLLNALLNEEKAIVSDIAGTTRDVIEDLVTIQGIQFRFIDTAGLRKTQDKIETLGIERTLQKINQAAIVLLLVDAQDEKLPEKIKTTKKNVKDVENKKLIVLINKIDRLSSDLSEFEGKLKQKYPQSHFVFISAKHKTNITKLTDELLASVNYASLQDTEVIVTNVRHVEALKKADTSLQRAHEGLISGISGDFLSQDIREALHHLGEITGEITSNEVLGNIFQRFCIGK